ncbi:MAG: hypothetical protein NVS1B7_4980 [Candidatus Saccharimonadales bacterium]
MLAEFAARPHSSNTLVTRRNALKLLAGSIVTGYALTKAQPAQRFEKTIPILPPQPPEKSRADHIMSRLGAGVGFFIVPHPDDELSVWSLVQKTQFPFFVLLTQGESSAHCQSHGGRGSERCKTDRVNSFHQFLNNYYEVNKIPVNNPLYDLYIGAHSARMVFDYGDQKLAPLEVTEAIALARSVSRSLNHKEQYLISAGVQYGHPDHLAIYSTIQQHNTIGRLAVAGIAHPETNFNATVVDPTAATFGCPNGNASRAYEWLLGRCGADTVPNQLPVQEFIEF